MCDQNLGEHNIILYYLYLKSELSFIINSDMSIFINLRIFITKKIQYSYYIFVNIKT